MAQQPTPNPPTNDTTESAEVGLRRLREWVAALVAILVLLGTFYLVYLAVTMLGDDKRFAQVKDLLLFVNPLLGVVIGYYFNRTTSEARAENAEATAKRASATAQQALDGQKTAQAEATEAKKTLNVLTDAAERALGGARRAGTLGAEETGTTMEEIELRLALDRAKSLLK